MAGGAQGCKEGVGAPRGRRGRAAPAVRRAAAGDAAPSQRRVQSRYRIRPAKEEATPPARGRRGRGHGASHAAVTPRLLALDVDGTLLRSDNTLSAANAAALAAARARGWEVVLATGKPPWAIAWLAKRLDLPGPHVVANGAAVWTSGSGTRLLEEIAPTDVRTALRSAETRGAARAVSGPSGVFCQPGWGEDAVAGALRAVGEDPPSVVPDAMAAEDRYWKVITISYARDGDPPVPTVPTGRWVRTGPSFYEVVPARATKAAALHVVCEGFGVPPTAVAAFGDSGNDVEMLGWAGLGVAMAHAPAPVRAAADVLAPGNDEDGVAAVVERLLRERP